VAGDGNRVGCQRPPTPAGSRRFGAPHAVYKIIGWQKADGVFTARGYIIKQDDTGSDLTAFLESIDTIEAAMI
jgi:hypothetical protein